MKKTILLIVIMMIAQAYLISQQPDIIKGSQTYNKDLIKIQQIHGYDLVEYQDKNIYYNRSPGEPYLPHATIKVLVPMNAVDIKLTIKNAEYSILKENCIVYPSQVEVPVSMQKSDFIHPEKVIYAMDAMYPAKAAVIAGESIFRGYKTVTLSINLVRTNPHKHMLYFLNQIDYEITYKTDSQRAIPAYHYNESIVDIIGQKISNPTSIKSLYADRNHLSRLNTVDCLIITNQLLKDTFTWYAHERQKQTGLQYEVITIEDIYNHYPGATNELKIKTCVREYAQTKNTLYILLGGDDTIVPTPYCYGYMSLDDPLIPTDLFYACFDNNFDWNGDGDDRIGEKGDNGDYDPDVFIGRLPMRTDQQIRGYLSKIQKYIDRCRTDVDYTKNLLLSGTMLAFHGDDYGKNESMYNRWIKPYWNCTKHTLYESRTPVTKSAFKSAMSNGINAMHMACHGVWESWRLTPPDRYYAEDGLSGYDAAAFIATIACKTNGFDSAEPCLSEGFIRSDINDNLVFVGSSRSGFGDFSISGHGASYYYSRGFFENLLMDSGQQSEHTAGKAVAMVKHDMIGEIGSRSENSNRWVHFTLNLMGDPTLKFYKELQIGPTPTPIPTTTPGPVNVARNKTVTVSGQYSLEYPGTALNDGNEDTIWGSLYNSGPQWFYVDLDYVYTIEHIIVKYYDPYFAPIYYIGVSNNGIDWTIIETVTNTTGGVKLHHIQQQYRYIGLYLTNGAMKVYGLKEFEVYAFQ